MQRLAVRLAIRSSARAASTLVLVEHDGANVARASLSAVTAAVRLGGPVTAMVVGSSCGGAATAASKIAGVTKVLVADDAQFAKPLAERVTAALKAAQDAGKYTHIVASATSFAKNSVPRLGADFDVQPISEVTDIKDEATFVRPIYAGNAILTVKSKDKLKILTIRPTAFEPAAVSGGSATVEAFAPAAAAAAAAPASAKSKFVSAALAKSDRPELGGAAVVISGGRGMKSGENFKMLEKLADLFGGAVGASRAAVDDGMVPNDLQIGQTGKIVAPQLYVAVAISGAIQHLAGMKDSKTIVAINKDPEAPIFSVADIGLVADLFTAVPDLTAKVAKAKGK